MFSNIAPKWSSFKISDSAEYLDFFLGPAAHNIMWDGAIRKATDTVRRWKQLNTGFFFNILACNVYILPVFSYIGQLVHPDHKTIEFTKFIERQLFRGPGNWIPKHFLSNLQLF